MLSLLTALLCAVSAIAVPAEPNIDAQGKRPTPTPTFGPPPSSFPSSLPEVPYTSTSVWLPPRPTEYPVHNGPLDATPVWIYHPGGAPLYSMCLTAEVCGNGKGRGRGAKVHIANCNDSPSQSWAFGIQAGPQVKLSGTEMCLDAGRNPRPGSKLVVAPCDNSARQNWFVANNGLWILNDRDADYLCADIKGGSRAEGTELQLWPCATWNFNQHFYPGFCWSHTCIM